MDFNNSIYLIIRWYPQVYVIGAFKSLELSKLYTSNIDSSSVTTFHGPINIIKPYHMLFYPKRIYALIDVSTCSIVGVYTQPELAYPDFKLNRFITGSINISETFENIPSISPNSNNIINATPNPSIISGLINKNSTV